MKRYKLFNSLFILLFFNIPAVVILYKSTSIVIYIFIQMLGVMLIAGYQVPFKKKLIIRNNTSLIRGYFYTFWIIITIIVMIKVSSVGFPGQNYVGRTYETAFMSSYSILTKLYLFAPIISAAIILLEGRVWLKVSVFILSMIMLFLPGVKGNVFLFLFILVYFNLLETKKLMKTIILFSLLVTGATFLLFYVSHFVIRSSLDDTSLFDTASVVAEKIWLYFQPNFRNLALTIEKSEIFQFGAVFMYPVVETVTLGAVRTTGEGQIWYFVDPNLKAGTFARDFWQDWGIMAPFFTFFLGVLYSWLFSLVDGDSEINKLLLSILSFPFAFVFFYNEFSRNQIIFGVILVILVVQNARRIRF